MDVPEMFREAKRQFPENFARAKAVVELHDNMPPEEERQFAEWLDSDPENFWNLVNSIELGERPPAGTQPLWDADGKWLRH